MRATTSGVTHKNQVLFGNNIVLNFIESEKQKFKDVSFYKKTFYDKNNVVGDVALNYLNIIVESNIEKALKNIILKEYYSCESIYPYLGDYFLTKLFAGNLSHKKKKMFSKKSQNDFLCQIKSKHAKNIAKWIFENVCLKRSINIESYLGEDIAVEILDDFIFKCSYDYDFFKNINSESLKNYKFVIINGIIESVSEIHHLLHKANENKEPYVIFCYGVSEEVKHTIIKNNNMGKLRVYPVCLNSNDENTLNILNDFAVIQGGSVISSDLGQSISQEVRKDLSIGNEIKFIHESIIIKPNVSDKTIKAHRDFIKKRIDDAFVKTDVKLEPLQNRLKSFTSSRLNIYIPAVLKKDKKFIRELDYILRFLSSLKLVHTAVEINEEIFYIPTNYINISNEKLKSLKTNLSNIQAFIL